jgi:hypothetical protein
MEPHMSDNDKLMFYKYLDNAKYYFEFGAGGSTYQASLRQNIKKIYSVESMQSWIKTINDKIQSDKIEFIFVDLKNNGLDWGYPSQLATNEDKKKYSDSILPYTHLDCILIDGRFRVACALKAFRVIDENCVILFDDFLDRNEYHIVLNYFEIIEKTSDNRMVALKKQNVNPPTEQLIKQYEIIPK